MAALLFAQPPDPLAFIAAEAARLEDCHAASRPGGLFSTADLRALFSMYDPSGKGCVSGKQVASALGALGLDTTGGNSSSSNGQSQEAVPVEEEGAAYTADQFVAALEGAINQQARLFSAAPVQQQ